MCSLIAYSSASNISVSTFVVQSILEQINQLDMLLNKASEYSSFIQNDLDELQAGMAEVARKKMEKAEKKRRKSEGKESSRKKRKTSSGGDQALQSAITKDAKNRAGGKPIFIQPPNLAANCFLKDYQLEGVRWMASLFENGVSGILADEVSSELLFTFQNTIL